MTDRPHKNEDEYFARRDAELLRQHRAAAQQAAAERERKKHAEEAKALMKKSAPNTLARVFRAVAKGVTRT